MCILDNVFLFHQSLIKMSNGFEGCGFVKFSNREMAMAAINALNGIYTMKVSLLRCFDDVMVISSAIEVIHLSSLFAS